MTFNTGNPIGSTDARDLSDNAENFDRALGTLSATWVDRFGVTRDSFEGRLEKSSFYRVGTFAAGYTLTNMRQALEYDGHEYSWAGAFPKVVAIGATPATSGGIGAGAWVDRTDDSLRNELSLNDSTVLVGGKSAKDLAHKNGTVDNLFDVAPAINPSNAVNLATAELLRTEEYRKLNRGKLEVIAHRGFATKYPENTLTAFRCSIINENVDAIETDISITSDGYRVLCHDATIDRTSNGSGTISALSLATLRTYDFGSWFNSAYTNERIPLFSEFLSLAKLYSKRCFPELKNITTLSDIDAVISDIYAADMQLDTVVCSFGLWHLEYFRTLNTEIELGYLMQTTPTSTELDTIEAMGGMYIVAHYSYITQATVDECKSRGIGIAAWTIDNSRHKKSLLNLGVKKFISNVLA